MIYTGTNIQTPSDALKGVDLGYIHEKIVNPSPDLLTKIERLRAVREIDPSQYSTAKKSLPYLVCGCFNPPYRRKENFAYIEFFIVDIDGISKAGHDIDSVCKKFKDDLRTVMLFRSPSGDGIKVLFRLEERCYDPGVYSLFYKAFVRRLGQTMGLSDVIDMRTSDVSRACFYSYDPDAYYNPLADCVDINDYMDTDDVLSMFDLKKEIETAELNEKSLPVSDPVSDETLSRIKSLLVTKEKTLAKKEDFYVPKEVECIMSNLSDYLMLNGVTVNDVRDIQYGKKLSLSTERNSAEVNIFFGKRGYTVVYTPKRGTSLDLNMACADLVRLYIAENVA